VVKILSRAGVSLADTYDVQGSIAGIEQLESREVTLAHEMGATIFSERLSGSIRRANTGDILQSVSWNIVLSDLPNFITRVLGVQVFADDSGRVNDVTVSIRDEDAGREIPIFAWDLNFTNVVSRIEDNGGGVNTVRTLVNAIVGAPSLLIGDSQPQAVNRIAFRGSSTAFGAGNVNVTMVLYQAFTHIAGGLSSFGLPIPSY